MKKRLMRSRILTPAPHIILNHLKHEKYKHIPEHVLGCSCEICVSLLDSAEFTPLKAQFQKRIKKYIREWKQYTLQLPVQKLPYLPEQNLKIESSWFSIMEERQKLSFHAHERSIVSGVYYPHFPKGSVNLIIEGEEIDIRAGYLYLFPSWAEHGTEENQSKERYVIAFNVGIA